MLVMILAVHSSFGTGKSSLKCPQRLSSLIRAALAIHSPDVIRLLTSCIHALMSDKMSVDDVCETTFRCRPWYVDMFLEVNNGRILTLYDLGRFDYSIRVGLAKILKDKRWGLVVAGSSVRYRRRVRMFDKVTIRTQVVGFDKQWIYVVQSMWVNEIPTSSVVLRTGITNQGKVMPADDVLKALNIDGWRPEPNGWVKDWIHSEDNRVWPPEKTGS